MASALECNNAEIRKDMGLLQMHDKSQGVGKPRWGHGDMQLGMECMALLSDRHQKRSYPTSQAIALIRSESV